MISVFRRKRLDRERVHRPCQFVGKSFIDHPVTLNQGFAPECFRNDFDAEVGLPFGPRSRVSRVQMGFILHLQ